ncbi:hypothetical protein J6590_107914, partial [Homalodisca vitripennis]
EKLLKKRKNKRKIIVTNEIRQPVAVRRTAISGEIENIIDVKIMTTYFYVVQELPHNSWYYKPGILQQQQENR